MAGEFTVDPAALTKAGNAILGIADEVHGDVAGLIGVQQADASANAGLSTATTAAGLAAGWERALEVLGAGLATAGDTLTRNAGSYTSTEQVNAAKLTAAGTG